MKLRIFISAAFISSALTGGVALAGTDTTLDQVPAPVRAAIKKEVGKGIIEDIEVETRGDGSKVYEVEFELDDVEWELDLDASGKVLQRKKDD